MTRALQAEFHNCPFLFTISQEVAACRGRRVGGLFSLCCPVVCELQVLEDAAPQTGSDGLFLNAPLTTPVQLSSACTWKEPSGLGGLCTVKNIRLSTRGEVLSRDPDGRGPRTPAQPVSQHSPCVTRGKGSVEEQGISRQSAFPGVPTVIPGASTSPSGERRL